MGVLDEQLEKSWMAELSEAGGVDAGRVLGPREAGRLLERGEALAKAGPGGGERRERALKAARRMFWSLAERAPEKAALSLASLAAPELEGPGEEAAERIRARLAERGFGAGGGDAALPALAAAGALEQRCRGEDRGGGR